MDTSTLIDLHRELTQALPLAGSRQFANGPTRAELRHEAAWSEDITADLADLYREPLKEPDRLPATEVLLLAYLLNYYRDPIVTASLQNTLAVGIVGGIALGGQAALEMLGLPGRFSLSNRQLLTQADAWATALVNPSSAVSLTNTTANELTAQIMTLRIDGLSGGELAAAMSQWIDGRSVVRAGNIAQNETVRADRTGLVETYQRNDIVEVVFRTRGDQQVDGGNPQGPCAIKANLTYPINAAPQIPIHFGCRCWYEAVTDGWEKPTTVWTGA